MLSLADQLSKFEKQVFENNLDDIITVQDGFSNGSVTIRDLVKQNHLIIHEFKKMKNVFINYTKINKKIYDRVTQYELNFGANILKIGNLTNFFQKTIEGTLEKMKTIYEDTVHQNSVSYKQLQQIIIPIHESIKQKVDQNYFLQQIKLLNGSSENDSLQLMKFDHSKSLDDNQQERQKFHHSKQGTSNNNIVNNSQGQVFITKKSNKKISAEEINHIKQSVMQQMQDQNKQVQNKFQQIRSKIQTQRKYNRLQLQQLYIRIWDSTDQKFKDQQELIKKNIKKIEKELQEKTSDVVWQKHRLNIIKQIDDKFIQNIKESIQQIKHNNQKQQKINLRNLNQLRKSLQAEIENTSDKILNEMQYQNQRLLKKNQNLNFALEQMKVQFKDYKSSLFQQLQNIKKQNKNQHIQFHNLMSQLKQTIQKISLTLEATVLKGVIKRFQQNFNTLSSDFQKIKLMEVQTSKKVVKIFETIKDMKQVISKKANFSDICHLFQKKASKDQISEIKDFIFHADTPKRQIQSVVQNVLSNHKQRKNSSQSNIKRSSETTRKMTPQKGIEYSYILGLNKTQRTNKDKNFQAKRLRYRPVTANNISVFN